MVTLRESAVSPHSVITSNPLPSRCAQLPTSLLLNHSAPLACQPQPLPQSQSREPPPPPTPVSRLGFLFPLYLVLLVPFVFSSFLAAFSTSPFLCGSSSWSFPPAHPQHLLFPSSRAFVNCSGTETRNTNRSGFSEPLAKAFNTFLCCFLSLILQISLKLLLNSDYYVYLPQWELVVRLFQFVKWHSLSPQWFTFLNVVHCFIFYKVTSTYYKISGSFCSGLKSLFWKF